MTTQGETESMTLHSGKITSVQIQLGRFSLSIRRSRLVIKPFPLLQYSERDIEKPNTERKR
jgi:hypothetical protein